MTNTLLAEGPGNATHFDGDHEAGSQLLNKSNFADATPHYLGSSRRRSDLTMNSSPVTRLEADGDSLQRIVMHAFRLRPIFRKVFLLCDVQQFTVSETAVILDISPTAVIARLQRARREMNARLSLEP